MKHDNMILVGGWLLILFSVLYVGITILIDIIIQGQPLLYDLSGHELFKVMAGTPLIRILLSFYAIVPALLIPSSVGVYYAFKANNKAAMRVGMHFATVGSAAMILSLMMLPSINWHLATYIPAVSDSAQSALIVLLKSFHSYFGIYVGDILGLGSILVWFLITSVAMLNSTVFPRPLGIVQLAIAIIGVIVLFLRYSEIFPTIHLTIQINGIIALWTFICGIGLVSLRNDVSKK